MTKKEEKLIEQGERRQAYGRAYMTRYRSEHPERIMQSRLRQAVNLLTKNGYTVIEPDTDANELYTRNPAIPEVNGDGE